MDHPAITERAVERVRADGRSAQRDALAIEAPLELRAGGEAIVMVMRTPGDDLDLARGLLYAEGVIDGAADLAGMAPARASHPAEEGNVLELGLAADAVRARMPERSLYASSACGVCGKTSIASLEQRAAPVRSALVVDRAVVAGVPDTLRAAQHVFAATGGLHAAGAFDPSGALLAAREDVGRHNAVDKLVGWALAAGRVPLDEVILGVSGRLSFEIVQKAVVAGVPVVVAVSAPSSLAVDLAERFGVTLCGFTRAGGFNVYSHSTRIS
ncbi:MAG TPA: formate dehydrogenase accessory sulfurtransferase FdhD [Kofleriaceae bacterium]|nr:formate dehydrogenase accessory sulfurtransferase FdhD [Kofleriaceae bacterium]